MKSNLADIARVVRSKNAGPFELTLDIIFDSPATFARVRTQKLIDRKTVARLYKVPVDRVLSIRYFEAAQALKITMKRWQPSGGPGERDVYGAQQHVPLLSLELDVGAGNGEADS